MHDDEWFEQLKRDAAPLRYRVADPWTVDRLTRGVLDRLEIDPAPPAFVFLSRWLRPLGAAFALVTLLCAGAAVLTKNSEEPPPVMSAEMLLLEEVSYDTAE